jgi:D-glycero-D-manno-heptose 1,7-bisphosphate phosphatase
VSATVLPAGVVYTDGSPLVSAPRAALLLDRDGTLVREVNYLHKIGDLRLQPGAVALVKAANAAGVAVAAVSNQSGIDRGMFGWDAYRTIEHELRRRLAARGAALNASIANGFHPDHTKGWGERHAHWRKPGPGMLQVAVERLGARPRRTWMVGDMATDAAAAKAAGLAGAVHLLTGHGLQQRREAAALASRDFPVLVARSLTEAREVLAEQGLFG